MDRDRKEQLLDGSGAARRARLRGRIGHLLEELERVPVRAPVLVDRHSGRESSALRGGAGPARAPLQKLEVTGSALEGGEPARPASTALRAVDADSARRRRRTRRRALRGGTSVRPPPLARLPRSDLTIPLAMLVCTIGDLTLDVVVRLAGPVAAGGDVDADDPGRPGGQAANVAAWATTLGVGARFVGRTGADDAGALARAKLAALGVEIVGPVGGRNGTICSLVSPSGERSMASDRGTARELAARGSRARVARVRPPPRLRVRAHGRARAGAALARRRARARGGRPRQRRPRRPGARSATVASRRSAKRFAPSAPDVVFANEDEERVVGRTRRRACGSSLAARAAARSTATSAWPLPVGRVDSTGAGDALAAGWIVGGPDLALEAAARCVRQLGAMPIPSPGERADRDLRRGSRRARRRTRRSSPSRRPSSRMAFRLRDGVAVGRAMEDAVRDAGATPATIGVLDGRIRVGLSEDELGRFDSTRGRSARATSPPARSPATWARPPSAASLRSRAASGSASSGRAASAVSTVATRRLPTSPPTSSRS